MFIENWKHRNLVIRLLKARPGQKAELLQELVDYLNNKETPFRKIVNIYTGCGGAIRVDLDIYGPEVYLGFIPGSEMLDCCPEYYGLTKEESNLLFHAILSCVPGTTDFLDKVNRIRDSTKV